ncbi:MAG: glycerol-3-phosphate 1-O-acyltransferase PlsY [Spirochaetales bacterium]|jgi:glycerol-3-phosphate acyltransferase PlsY|nr:glycerol-3-phosphate 1-O-acyltransferase PlsY [Exilispira sp.]NMC67043.1 glycerol-3-phosphate 1-O-acyltransferase PlsY [Spirochaetales bacterium]
MIFFIIYLLISFLIGAIPTGLIIGRIKKVDIRSQGSRNIGATNVTRTLGPIFGIITLFIDCLKAFFPLILFKPISSYFSASQQLLNLELSRSIIAVAILCGNTFNPFLRFKGGKGVATGLGIMLFLNPIGVAISFAIFFITVLISKYVSLGSILAVITIIISSFFLLKSFYIIGAIILIGLIVLVRHKENIKRLLNSTENKFAFKKNKK